MTAKRRNMLGRQSLLIHKLLYLYQGVISYDFVRWNSKDRECCFGHGSVPLIYLTWKRLPVPLWGVVPSGSTPQSSEYHRLFLPWCKMPCCRFDLNFVFPPGIFKTGRKLWHACYIFVTLLRGMTSNYAARDSWIKMKTCWKEEWFQVNLESFR